VCCGPGNIVDEIELYCTRSRTCRLNRERVGEQYDQIR